MANKKDCDSQLEKIYIIHYRCMSATFHSTLLKARDDFALKMLQKCIKNFYSTTFNMSWIANRCGCQIWSHSSTY